MSVIKAQNYNILIDEEEALFASFIDRLKPSSVFVIVDENTELYCLPRLKTYMKIPFSSIRISSGEQYKNLKTSTQIWNALISHGADRKSLIINLGGGVIGDMGGFVASTYMRGMRFIQIPTSLLSQVDAGIGGKLGIDFLAYKNMIGVFNNPEMVWIDSSFLNTLPDRELNSGLAEIYKHALIHSNEHWDYLSARDKAIRNWPFTEIIERSVIIKNEIVEQDPFEQGLRKILNFGHTIGHAVETYFSDKENALLHGEAIFIGMICEAYVSYTKSMISRDDLEKIQKVLSEHIQERPSLLGMSEELLGLLKKDKKNTNQKLMLSLLNGIGSCAYDIECHPNEITDAFRFFDNY